MRLVINADAIEDRFGRTLRAGALLHPARRFSELKYVALTETSLNDRGFVKPIAEEINRVFFDARRGLILRAPPNAGGSRDVEDRMRAVISALASARPRVPCGRGRQRAAGDLGRLLGPVRRHRRRHGFRGSRQFRFLASFPRILPCLPQHLGARAGAPRRRRELCRDRRGDDRSRRGDGVARS